MKASTLNLDLSKTEAESSSMFSKVPEGDYEVTLAHAQFKDGKNAGAAGLQVGYMIEAGPHKGKLLQDYINIMNDNEDAVKIGHRRLRKILELQKRTSFVLKTDADLVNTKARFMVSVAIEMGTYKDKPVENCAIKKLFEKEGPSAPDSAASKGVTRATTAKTAPVVAEAPAEEAEEEDDATPPWMK